MSSTTLVLAGLGACVAWLLAFFELARIFNRPNPGALVRSEMVQMLTAVLLVCLLCFSVAVLTQGLDQMLPFGVLVAFGIALVVFIALFVIIGAMFRGRQAAAVPTGTASTPK